MVYSYYSTEQFKKFRERFGYEAIGQFSYLGTVRQEWFAKYQYLARIARKFLPYLLIDIDLVLARENLSEWLAKYHPRRLKAVSFEKLDIYGLTVKEKGTFIIDLNRSIDNLWLGMNYSLRKQIKKAERASFSITRADNLADFKQYYNLLRSSRKRAGLQTLPFFTANGQWDCLHKNNGSCYEVFLCYNSESELLAGLGLFVNPETGQCIEVAAARSEKAAKLPAGDFLKWEMIKWAKSRGLKYFDLAGVDAKAAPGTKDFNIYRYKAKWGGAFYPVYYYQSYRTHKSHKSYRSYIDGLWKQLNWRYYWGDPLDVRYYLCEQLSKIKNKKVLDLACGPGIIMNCLDNSNEVTGIELNGELVKIAQELNPGAKIIQADMFSLMGPISSISPIDPIGQFDVVILANVLPKHDFASDRQPEELIKIADNLLKSGGKLFLTTPNADNRYYKKRGKFVNRNYLKKLFGGGDWDYKIRGWNPFPIQAGHFLRHIPGIFVFFRKIMEREAGEPVAWYLEVVRKLND